MKTVIIKFEGIDSFNRPVFRDISSTCRYGSTDKLFNSGTSREDILKDVRSFDLCFFGNSFGCEPMGGILNCKLVIVENTISHADLKEKLQGDLFDFALLLQSKDFNIVFTNWDSNKGRKTTYFHFELDSKIGYVQNDRLSGNDFSSCYMGGREHGGGARYTEDFAELTLSNAIGCFNHTIGYNHSGSIKFYSGLEHFLGNQIYKDNKYILEASNGK